MEEDEEDIYAPEEPTIYPKKEDDQVQGELAKDETMNDDHADGEEDVEIDEDESDSDIDIITERKDTNKTDAAAQPPRVGQLKTGPARISSPGILPKAEPSPALKTELPAKTSTPVSRPGSSYPPVKISKIDVDAKPIFEPLGKPITEVDMDADFPEDDKPWRKPGTDMTDYFNYGFDEFTWASYCLKQETLRKEVADQKKQMEDMQNFLTMPGSAPGGMPMPGIPSAGVPGMADVPPELQQMMQQMMASGMDPSQMDFNSFSQMMTGAGQGAMGGQAFGQQGQQQQQQQQQPQMGYGYGAGGGGGQGGNRGQGGGRGHNRRW